MTAAATTDAGAAEGFAPAGARQNGRVTVPGAGRAEAVERAPGGRPRVLEALRSGRTGLGIRELAAQAGLHPNTVRFHVERLVEEGLVARTAEPRTTPGRPRLTFTAVSRPDLDGDRRNYRMLAEMLAGYLSSALPDPAVQASELGRAWGGYLANRPAPYRHSTEEEARAELLRVLDEIGFEPEIEEQQAGDATAGQRVRLRHCPFLEVAVAHREVACSIHLGLMEGVLGELRAPLAADGLQPFAEPSACIARLRRGPAATGDGVPD